MKRVMIKAYEKGLVFQNGRLIQVLSEGAHWVWFDRVVEKYDMTMAFQPAIELNILLENKELLPLLHIVEVKDNEIALLYKDGNYAGLLTPGRHVYWKTVVNHQFQVVDLNELAVTNAIDRKLFEREALAKYVRVYVVASYEEGLLFVDGKFVEKLQPGMYFYWKNQQAIGVMKADLRQQQIEVSGQEMLTKDKAAIRVNFDAIYKIEDVEKALMETKDFGTQLYHALQLVLREYVGTLTLDELLSRKQMVQEYVMDQIAEKVATIGCAILSCGIRDIILPGEVKDIMNQVLIAEKKAQANIITRREETASTRSLLNTAKLMEDNAMLYKLKEMEYVEKIADKIHTISLSGGSQVVDQLKEIFT